MSKYRIANYHILQVKLDGRPPAARVDSILTLHRILDELLAATASRHYGNLAEELATEATPLALARVRRCLWANIAYTLLRGVLTEAYRLRLAFQNRPTLDSAAEAPSLLLTALCRLFHLAHRSWLFLALYKFRDGRAGWIGRLSDLYLGKSPSGGTRQALLTGDRARLEEAIGELALAESALGSRVPSTEPVHLWLSELDTLVKQGKIDLTQPSGWRTLVNHCVSASARAASKSTDYRAVAQALAALQGVVAGGGASVRDLENVAVELHALFEATPGSAAGLHAPAAYVWLDALAPDHAPENAPGNVLANILKLPVAAPPGISEEVRDRRQLLDCMHGNLAKGSPAVGIMAGLLRGESFDDICDKLAPALPPPAHLAGNFLNGLADRLQEWHATAQRWRTASSRGGCSFNCQDMPREVRASLDVAAIERARTCAAEWMQSAAARPRCWADVPANAELPLRGALFTLYLDELVFSLRRCYGQAPAGEIVGAIVEQ